MRPNLKALPKIKIFTQFSHYAQEFFFVFSLCTWILYLTFSENVGTSRIKKKHILRNKRYVVTFFSQYVHDFVLLSYFFMNFLKKQHTKIMYQVWTKTHVPSVKIMYIFWFCVHFMELCFNFVQKKTIFLADFNEDF